MRYLLAYKFDHRNVHFKDFKKSMLQPSSLVGR